MDIKYYVLAVMPCPDCNGTKTVTIKGRSVPCDRCNMQGEIEVKVPLGEALQQVKEQELQWALSHPFD